jgi:hypothetical protein
VWVALGVAQRTAEGIARGAAEGVARGAAEGSYGGRNQFGAKRRNRWWDGRSRPRRIADIYRQRVIFSLERGR